MCAQRFCAADSQIGWIWMATTAATAKAATDTYLTRRSLVQMTHNYADYSVHRLPILDSTGICLPSLVRMSLHCFSHSFLLIFECSHRSIPRVALIRYIVHVYCIACVSHCVIAPAKFASFHIINALYGAQQQLIIICMRAEAKAMQIVDDVRVHEVRVRKIYVNLSWSERARELFNCNQFRLCANLISVLLFFFLDIFIVSRLACRRNTNRMFTLILKRSVDWKLLSMGIGHWVWRTFCDFNYSKWLIEWREFWFSSPNPIKFSNSLAWAKSYSMQE